MPSCSKTSATRLATSNSLTVGTARLRQRTIDAPGQFRAEHALCQVTENLLVAGVWMTFPDVQQDQLAPGLSHVGDEIGLFPRRKPAKDGCVHSLCLWICVGKKTCLLYTSPSPRD